MGVNTFPTFSQAKWWRQNIRWYYEERWNEEKERSEYRRSQEVVMYKECKSRSTQTAAFAGFFSQIKLPVFRVYWADGQFQTFEAFRASDIDVYDLGTGVSRVTVSAIATKTDWLFELDGDFFIVGGDNDI